MNSPVQHASRLRAFTILETMVASAVLVLMLALVFSAISGASTVTRRATEKIGAFQSARAGFDIVTETLAQATMNSYWDYVDSSGNFRTASTASTFTPFSYARNSELHFLIGNAGSGSFPGTRGTGQALVFQARTGLSSAANERLNQLLNTYGFFVEYGPVETLPQPFTQPPPTYRYQLRQVVVEAENFDVYDQPSGSAWLASLGTGRSASIASNIVFLAVWPRRSPYDDPAGSALTSAFTYDSRAGSGIPQPETQHQLPPIVQVTMVAIDETSATRFCTTSEPPREISDAFQGLFIQSNETAFQADLQELERRMSTARIGMRVFTAQIPLRESKMQ